MDGRPNRRTKAARFQIPQANSVDAVWVFGAMALTPGRSQSTKALRNVTFVLFFCGGTIANHNALKNGKVRLYIYE